MNSKNRFREIAIRVGLSLFSLMFTFVILEGVVRVFFFDQVDTAILTAQLEAISVKETIQASSNPIIHYELKPNLHTEFQGVLVVTSSEGYRVSEQSQTPQRDAIRVAVLGDSISFGWGVSYEDSFPAIYKQMMEMETGVPIHLRNYSVSGYNTQQEVETFVQKGIPFQPDLIILSYNFNDPNPTGFTEYIHPEFGDNFLHSALIKLSVRKWKSYQLQNNQVYDQDQHEIVEGFIVAGPLYDAHLKELQRLATITQQLNIPTIVVIYDPFIDVEINPESDEYYEKLHKRITTHLTDMGFYVYDLYDREQAEMTSLGWTNLRAWWLSDTPPLDAHPTPDGNRFIAESLVDFTRQTPELAKIFSDKSP